MRPLVALALVLLALPAHAQRRGHAPDRVASRGDVALTFTADDVWDGFDNGGVGLRAWLGRQLVGSVSLGVELDRTDTEFGPDVERHAATLALGLEAHLGGSRTVSPFVGGGVRLGYAEVDGGYGPYDYTVVVEDCDTRLCDPSVWYPSYGRRSADELSVGAGLDLGAEVRLARGVTLLGAHRIGATFTSGEAESTGIIYYDGPCPELSIDCGFYGAPVEDYTRWEVGTGETRVALSVYF